VKPSIPVTLEHARLRTLGSKLASIHAGDPQLKALASALYRIGCGEDANVVFGLKRGKGQNPAKAQAHYKTQLAIRWIAGYMNPGDGSSPSKTAAISEAADQFELDPENLTRACPSIAALQEIAEFDWDSQRPSLTKPRD
jgi:hypothetical protein